MTSSGAQSLFKCFLIHSELSWTSTVSDDIDELWANITMNTIGADYAALNSLDDTVRNDVDYNVLQNQYVSSIDDPKDDGFDRMLKCMNAIHFVQIELTRAIEYNAHFIRFESTNTFDSSLCDEYSRFTLIFVNAPLTNKGNTATSISILLMLSFARHSAMGPIQVIFAFISICDICDGQRVDNDFPDLPRPDLFMASGVYNESIYLLYVISHPTFQMTRG